MKKLLEKQEKTINQKIFARKNFKWWNIVTIVLALYYLVDGILNLFSHTKVSPQSVGILNLLIASLLVLMTVSDIIATSFRKLLEEMQELTTQVLDQNNQMADFISKLTRQLGRIQKNESKKQIKN